MKQVINIFIGIFFFVATMSAMLLAMYTLCFVFTGEWYVAEGGKVVAGVIGFILGVFANCVYFDCK